MDSAAALASFSFAAALRSILPPSLHVATVALRRSSANFISPGVPSQSGSSTHLYDF
jgi:hypothetical protein